MACDCDRRPHHRDRDPIPVDRWPHDGSAPMPNTVAAPSVPLYQLGWLGGWREDWASRLESNRSAGLLGGDTYDITDLGPTVDAQNPMIDASLSYPPMTESLPSTIYNTPTYVANPNATGAQIANWGAVGPSFLQSLASFFSPKPSTTLPPGPSPRVNVPGILPSSFSLSSALPILAVVAVGALVLGRKR